MKEIRLAYAPLKNAGDMLNVNLIEKLSGKRVIRSKVYNADMMAIGGAIIGANSVVTKDIPDYAVAVVAPSKVIKQRGD